MKQIIALFLLFFPIFAIAKERENPFQQYKDNYFLVGNRDDGVEGQLSIKYYILYPFEYSPCIAYTQTFGWDIYEKSSPFKNYDHNPEAYYQFGEDSYIKCSVAHLSNGRDGIDNRSLNYYYAEGQFVFGDRVQYGINGQVRNYFRVSEDNHDIAEYMGYVQGELFVQLMNKGLYIEQEKFFIRGGGYKKGWIETGIQFRILTSYVQPRIFIQYKYGYCDSLLNYNEKEKSIRIGLLLQ